MTAAQFFVLNFLSINLRTAKKITVYQKEKPKVNKLMLVTHEFVQAFSAFTD